MSAFLSKKRVGAGLSEARPRDANVLQEGGASDRRRFDVYDPGAAFDLVDELEFLGTRSVEPNVFYAPQFLVPAMPRLDDRTVRLLVARDEDGKRSRLRLFMPFTVETVPFRRRVVRAWTHPFGPLGTLPLDRDDPEGILRDLFAALRERRHELPDVLVLPDLKIEGPMARLVLAAAGRAGLDVALADETSRAFLDASQASASFPDQTLSAKRRREMRRHMRLLSGMGPVSCTTAREPAVVREALEEFLTLEASGWKGRARSAMLLDRYRAAFARESVNRLAEHDRVRIFTLRVSGRAVASLVVFVQGGEAVAWKTAYDETHAKASPGFLVAFHASQALLADPAVVRVDSCAVPDHFVMNRLWRGRLKVATVVIGLTPGMGEEVAAIAAALNASRTGLNRRRIWRNRLKRLLGLR